MAASISTSILTQQRARVVAAKRRWANGEPPDAASLLSEVPREQWHQSVVLELAYEEFCLRRERGETVDIEGFLDGFSDVRSALRRQIDVHLALESRGLLSDLPDDNEWPDLGDDVAGFRLCELLGRGLSGRVFLAKQPRLNDRTVVVKLCRSGQMEANALAQVAHANIVPVHSIDYDEAWQLTVLCMPFVSRATLQNVLDDLAGSPVSAEAIGTAVRRINCVDDVLQVSNRPLTNFALRLPCDSVLEIGFRLAEALAWAHERGILHGDIKPSNILIDSFGDPSLIDFSLSSTRDATAGLGGTLPYMAPEQLVRLQSGLADEGPFATIQTDLYALGTTLCEFALGAHPVGGISSSRPQSELIDHILAGQRDWSALPAPATGRIDREAWRVISRCRAFAPEARPQSARELADELRSLLEWRSRFRRWRVWHRRWSLTAAVAAAAAATLTFGLWLMQPTSADRARDSARKLLAARRDSEAIEQASLALKAFPRDPELRKLRGIALLRSGQYRDAEPDLFAAWDSLPEAELELMMAYCSLEQKEYDVAIRWYNRLLERFPDSPVAYNNLGYAFLEQGNYEAAIEYLTTALKIDGRLGQALYNRALAQFRLALQRRELAPASALTDILNCNLLSGDVHLDAARIASQVENPDRRVVLDCVSRAVTAGLGRDQLLADGYLRGYHDDADFQRFVAAAPDESYLTRAVRVIPPF